MLIFDMMPEDPFKMSWMYMYLANKVENQETYAFLHISDYYYQKHCDVFGL